MTAQRPPVRPGPRVLVTGMGIVSAIGHTVDAFAASLEEGRSGIRRLEPDLGAMPAAAIGAAIAGFDFEGLLGRRADTPEPLVKAAQRVARRAPFTIQASVIAAIEAWHQAGLQPSGVAGERIGLVVAGHNTTRRYQYSLGRDFERQPQYLSPKYALHHLDSDQIGVLSQILGIKGEGMVAGGASASGNVGLIQGLRLVRLGLVDACLVAGVVADLSPMEWQAFHGIGALGGKAFADQPERACRPFDRRHEGFIPGQAAACLILESDESARRRGADGLAEILGGATALHATAFTDPDVDGEVRAMRGALRDAGLDAAAIAYVNTHGTSSPKGDQVEMEALRAVLGQRFPEVWVNATKGLTGHCLYSAGVVEAIATIVQFRRGFIHPNLNLEDPIEPAARFSGAAAIRAPVRTALSNSFGFGGINTSIVLRALA
ncbi:beta-ketoacyl synthase N-terminal-like domain-containing protein [Azospirillum brasilense]|uniref:beta-ketoacyl synthase N-terminal-like domain-containing protein n=1 Tax=Azospirillum brasilense TaxID=192 RepID=UPI002493FAC1|nr:beta-ketoacyl synthase N-terminal-like domain-containing protein [Azospirillum brasilense]